MDRHGGVPQTVGQENLRHADLRRDRLLAGVLTVGAHLAVLGALFWLRPVPVLPPAAPVLTLVKVQSPAPPSEAPPEPTLALAEAPQPARPVLPQLGAPSRITATAADTSDLLSAGQIAGAASAEQAGGGGGACNTARLVQQALQRDPLVAQAVEDAHRRGKSVMLWNGDWVRSGGQDGKGLSAVREAILWELAFAPEACRNQRLHGLVLLSLADGGTRFAVGAGDWRWSDLLGLRR